MPTPERNKETVSTFAREVFGNKNLDHADAWLADDFAEHQVFPGTTPDKQGAIDSYRIFFAASPGMTAEIHVMVADSDKVAIRATFNMTWFGGASRVLGIGASLTAASPLLSQPHRQHPVSVLDVLEHLSRHARIAWLVIPAVPRERVSRPVRWLPSAYAPPAARASTSPLP